MPVADPTTALLEHLLRAAPPDFSSGATPPVAEWLRERPPHEGVAPIDRAVAHAFAAPAIAHAFAAGYQQALRRLLPSLPDEPLAALCVTEAEGAHPSFIRTQLTRTQSGWSMTGAKAFVTLGADADLLLVVASLGRDPETNLNQLRLVELNPRTEGVELRLSPTLDFVPELSHAEVHLDRAAVLDEHVHPDDGYARFVKPFRTIEDIHVVAAVLTHLLAISRALGWPRDLNEALLATLIALRALASAHAGASGTHVALAGVLADVTRLLASLDGHWRGAPEHLRVRWQRDVALLDVAARVRTRRREAAWDRLHVPLDSPTAPASGDDHADDAPGRADDDDPDQGG